MQMHRRKTPSWSRWTLNVARGWSLLSNHRMPAEAKERVLGQLQQDKVPARMVERIESRMN